MTNIVKIFENVKFHLYQSVYIKKSLLLFNKILLSMMNNLTQLNLINYFRNNNFIFLKIKELKNDLDILENNNKIKLYKILKFNEKLLRNFNYICPNDFNLIKNIYFINFFNYFDKLKILFINDFFIPISIWDSNIKYNSIIKNSKKSDIVIFNYSISNEIIIKKPNINNDEIFPNIIDNSQSFNVDNDNIFNNYDINEIKEIVSISNIVIQKNKNSSSLIDNYHGCCIYLNLGNRIIVIQGLIREDLLNLVYKNEYIKNIIDDHNNLLLVDNGNNIPNEFKNAYFEILSLRDKIVLTSKEITDEIKKKYNDFKSIRNKPLILLMNEFLLGTKYRKFDILNLFLVSNDADNQLAYFLYNILKNKDINDVLPEIYNSFHFSIRNKIEILKNTIEKDEKNIDFNETDLSLEKRISLLQVSPDVKSKAYEKLKSIKNNSNGDGKASNWLDGLLKIPFNIYSENEIISFKKNNQDNTNIEEWNNYYIDRKKYVQDVKKILDDVVYGHTEAKKQIQRIVCNWINGENTGVVLGLHGPPGTGKTQLVKNGISKCLKNKNNEPRPFAFLPIGGAVNGSTLVGHNYTYVGSTWGKIVDTLITTKCLNPIIFIDELDKISNTENGREIISILTQLTDPTQNDEFEDKFFAGIKLDLSKALIIFSFNDIKLIDPILKDRITVIDTKGYKINEKVEIINNYMFPSICSNVGYTKNDFILNEDVIKHLIETYTLEAGVRKIKEILFEIVREVNLINFNENITFPFEITLEFCNKLFELRDKIRPKKLISENSVGLVHGLYASTVGLGGVTLIQAIKFYSDKFLDLHLTGSLGDVMKESIQYSLKIAFNLLPKEKQEEIINNKFGIHIHCPDGGTKKDGPSAGGAITLAIYSLLSDTKINNKVALTGEIDVIGNITAIGGLDTKISGAKKAGIEIVLYPEENQNEIDILRKEGTSYEDDNFKLIPVNNIKEILDLCLIK